MHSDKLPTGPGPEEIDESPTLSGRPVDTDAAPDTILKSPYGETPAVARTSILAAANSAPTASTPAEAEVSAPTAPAEQTEQTAPVMADTSTAPSADTPTEPDAAPDAEEATAALLGETAPAPASQICRHHRPLPEAPRSLLLQRKATSGPAVGAAGWCHRWPRRCY
ncbi:hypothetical protein [Actinomyces ruminis]|uniref:Uncharacterized protein n=1 Tax=Actinomyces ruminis TaxID=1937003 RepID=A0ABX4MEC4_9ACTO|nr:hypothetical protein [Actinomyces ruminis]PHP53798.1 hypothetical protein BW737_000025 [Actinomyces ruminis]